MSTAAAETEATDTLEESETESTSESTAEQKLSDLENAAAAAKKVNRDLERKLKANQDELDKLKASAAKAPAEAPDPEAIKAEARKEALAEAKATSDERVIRLEVKAAAGTKLADPNDAVRLLDLSEFEVDDDGNVDEKAIADAIDLLIKNKPYLAAQGGKRFQGGGDGGARKGPQTPQQLTETDVKRLYAEKNYAEIEQARQEGRLVDVLSGKQSPT